MLQLSLLLDTQDKLGVFVLSDRMLHLGDSHAGDVDIPAVDVVALGQCMHYACIDSVAVDDFDFRKADTLFKS
ncbi:hypothetical protein HG530_002847 [Fusarium avenaceum]|nr:hypothetical protein HG530_002847 [Fusarium avenaceum]